MPGLSLIWLRDADTMPAVFPQTKAVRQVKIDVSHCTSMILRLTLQQTKGLSGQSNRFLPSLGFVVRTENSKLTTNSGLGHFS